MKRKSTYMLFLFCSVTVCSWFILVDAHPTDNKDLRSSSSSLGFSSNELPSEVTKSEGNNPLTRNKRTVGFLRQLFPGISQIIDRKIQQITRILFRVVGRLILRGGANGGGGGGSDTSSGDGGGRKISITLPTYPPSDEDEDETQSPTEKDSSSTDTSPDTKSSDSSSSSTEGSSTSKDSDDSSAATTSPTDTPDNNSIARKVRDVSDVLSDTTISPAANEISSTAESTTKRGGFLWGLARGKRAGSLLGNGNGGSGNFVFDLIRLIAGSAVTPEKDEELNAPRDERDDDAVESADNNDVHSGSNSSYNPEDDTSGIPGPLTRFALLVNRGISNVFKDLILRLAQTSERIVNFKARLITAII